MSKKSWLKLGLLSAGAVLLAFPLWNCISAALWQTFFLRAVN